MYEDCVTVFDTAPPRTSSSQKSKSYREKRREKKERGENRERRNAHIIVKTFQILQREKKRETQRETERKEKREDERHAHQGEGDPKCYV